MTREDDLRSELAASAPGDELLRHSLQLQIDEQHALKEAGNGQLMRVSTEFKAVLQRIRAEYEDAAVTTATTATTAY
jgi:hypothetical protein